MSTNQNKRRILQQAKAWNPHPDHVTVTAFKTNPFFDPEDKVQVKYEMLRAREVEKAHLTETCSKFGFSRESYRHIRQRFYMEGIAGLFGHKRGRKGPLKATEELRGFIRSEHTRDRSLTAEALAIRCYQEYGVTISRRTVFRILEKDDGYKKKRW